MSSKRSMVTGSTMTGYSLDSSFNGRVISAKTQPIHKVRDGNGIDVSSRIPKRLLNKNKDVVVASSHHGGIQSKMSTFLGVGAKNIASSMLLGRSETTKKGGSTMGTTANDGGISMPFSQPTRSMVATGMHGREDGASQSMQSVMSSQHETFLDGEAKLFSGLTDVQTVRMAQSKENLTESDLEKQVDIELSMSDIHWFLDIPSTYVNPEEEDTIEQVTKENEIYTELLTIRENNRDNLTDRFAQTLHLPDKDKGCQATAVATMAVGCDASTSNIHDTFESLEKIEELVKQQEAGQVDITENDPKPVNLAQYKSHPRHPEYDSEKGNTTIYPDTLAPDVKPTKKPKKRTTEGLKKGPSIDIGDHSEMQTNRSNKSQASNSKELGSGPRPPRRASRPSAGSIRRPSSGSRRGSAGSTASTREAPAQKIPPRQENTEESESSCKFSIDDQEEFSVISGQDQFGNTLRVAERLVVRHMFTDVVKKYRRWPEDDVEESESETIDKAPTPNQDDQDDGGAAVVDENEDSEDVIDMNAPRIETLWMYKCDATEGRSVTCMTWNKHNLDILASGYGELEFGSKGNGLVCCWSLKNPKFPERVYRVKGAVCSLDFSEKRPSLLAVGMRDGTTAVFDVADLSQNPVVTSDDQPFIWKHQQPAWVVKWAKLSSDEDESVISGSTDGRVLKGTMVHNKGVQMTNLMRIKRITNKEGKAVQNTSAHTAFVAMQGTCMSLDFFPDDPTGYLIGTEDGTIHKCSVAYNEQFTRNYFGHGGPVYGVQCSPYAPEVFATCSADWTIRIWDREKDDSAVVLRSKPQAVLGCAWSPHSGTVLASVCSSGVAIWDLSVQDMDPVLVVDTSEEDINQQPTSVLFAKNTNAVLYGDTNGGITVAQVHNVYTNDTLNSQEEAQKLRSIFKPSNDTPDMETN
eukprot:m.30422 g.30422  ORF g.30422 m.30422 type:complete len:919 (+) comp8202_c0_seq1:364-3120(+)